MSSLEVATSYTHDVLDKPGYKKLINDICDLNWIKLPQEDLISVAWAYYYFSIQFRECLEIARNLTRSGLQPTSIAYRMARHYALVLEVKARQERGESLQQVQAEVGVYLA